MLKRAFSIALLSGSIAGIWVTAIQSMLVIPLILEAESYEKTDSTFLVPENPPQVLGAGHQLKHADNGETEEWVPDEGLERLFYTVGSNIVTGIAFGLLLVGVYLFRAKPVNFNKGLLWGAAGFVVFSVAPALGIPPELPGMSAANLGNRELWWSGTVVATAIGIGIFIEKKNLLPRLAALILLTLPHLIGAPDVVSSKSPVPAELSAQFAVSSLVSAALFWMMLGGVSGFFYQRLMQSREEHALAV